MTWISIFTGKSGFAASSTAEDVTKGVDGTGLTAIVTGATSGIGLETTRVLALRGVHVVMPVRNLEAGKKVKEDIIEKIPNAKLDVMELDISSQESVRKFASQFCSKGLPLNILILNAGIMTPPFSLSKDNTELQFATNHLGNFLLTNLLMDTMKKTAQESGKEGRIVILTSKLHSMTYKEGIRFDKINDEKSYNALSAYGQSKLANILHAKELTKRFKEEGVNITANSVHPGVIATNLGRHSGFNLDFSYNNLSGLVPGTGQFSYFNYTSFFSNPDLCGPYLGPCKDGVEVPGSSENEVSGSSTKASCQTTSTWRSAHDHGFNAEIQTLGEKPDDREATS